MELDSYGRERVLKGDVGACPYRYQGQYVDAETGLYYNRFRYFDSEDGRYVSQDPIGLAGGNVLYGYSVDCNSNVDSLGLKSTHYASNPKEAHAAIKDKWGDSLDANAMREIHNTIDRIKSNRPRYANDKTPFQNTHTIGNPNAQRLNTSNSYTEWTVKTPGVGNNGKRRIVVNNETGQAHYSHDHYTSFMDIDLGGWN